MFTLILLILLSIIVSDFVNLLFILNLEYFFFNSSLMFNSSYLCHYFLLIIRF